MNSKTFYANEKDRIYNSINSYLFPFPFYFFICISRSAYFYALSTSRISEDIYVAFFAHFRLFMYRKIPKMSPGAYIFQRPFLGGLYLEGLFYGRKFAF